MSSRSKNSSVSEFSATVVRGEESAAGEGDCEVLERDSEERKWLVGVVGRDGDVSGLLLVRVEDWRGELAASHVAVGALSMAEAGVSLSIEGVNQCEFLPKKVAKGVTRFGKRFGLLVLILISISGRKRTHSVTPVPNSVCSARRRCLKILLAISTEPLVCR